MAEALDYPAKALIGVSIPRAGHHFLRRILWNYFGREVLHYCEWYSVKDCCKHVPCVRTTRRINFQKSHDFDFDLPRDVEQALYVIQYRHPVPAALSDRELMTDNFAEESLDYRITPEAYAWWLASKAVYYRRFHDKWFCSRIPNGVYLSYDLLKHDPEQAVAPIFNWACGEAAPEKLSAAIAKASLFRGASPSEGVYKPRVLEESPYFDRDLLGAFEAYILERCPQFGFASELRGSCTGHWTYGLFLAQDEQEPLPAGEADRLQAAAKFAPGQPEIEVRIADRKLKNGEPKEAISILAPLLERHPHFGPGYRVLLHASKTIGQPVPAVALKGEALFAIGNSPNSLCNMAEAMLAENRPVNAVVALSLGAILQPRNFRVISLLTKALVATNNWTIAQEYAQRAISLRPKNKQMQEVCATIEKRVAGRQRAFGSDMKDDE
ncbi:MAG TPA: hypothetical protein VHU18_00145 [Rhizomicrobium sp.]|jgi:hypothetical protein|nr:hypothetical protein [Rhizomicrobium sp.]